MDSKQGEESDLIAECRCKESSPDGVMKKVQKQLQKLKLKWKPKKKYKDLSEEDSLEAKQRKPSSSTLMREGEYQDRAPSEDTTQEIKHPAVSRASDFGNVHVKAESSFASKAAEVASRGPCNQDRQAYDFTHRKRGFAVLVIYNNFKHQPQRDSAILDIDSMTAVFNTLGFDVLCLQNEPTELLLKKMKVIRDHIKKDHDCFACVVSTHGAEVKKKNSQLRQQILYTYDGTVTSEELFEIFKDRNCEALRGKPRIFFVQACRGVMPERKNHSDVDRGTDVYVSSHTTDRNKAVHGYQCTHSGNDNPVPSETQGHKSETESTADTRQNYEDYYRNQRMTGFDDQRNVFEKCENAMGEIDDITRRIQQRTMSRGTEQGDVTYDPYRNVGQNGHFQNNFSTDLENQLIPRGANVHTQNIPFADDIANYYTWKPPEPLDFCTIPVYNDYIAMFSAASGTIAWSDGDKGGWLLYCLYNVVKALRKYDFNIDLLQILTDTAGKMAREMRSYNSDPKYDNAKAAAVVYHRLRKEIYLNPKADDLETYNE